MLGGPEAAIEFLKLGVVAGFGEEGEAFAGAGFDEGGDHQAIDEFAGAQAFADELAELVGVGVGVLLGETAAAAGEEAADDGEMFDFVAGDGGHGGDPILGRAGLGPAVEEFEGVAGGFLFQVGVIVEQREWAGAGRERPRRGRFCGGVGDRLGAWLLAFATSYNRPMIHPTRVRQLNDGPVRRGRYVLYWMQASQRTRFNHALEYAIEEANRIGVPVVVGFGLMDDYPEANARHYLFMLQGLADVRGALAERGIQFVVRHGAPAAVALELAAGAAMVVCDRGYLRHQKAWRDAVADGAGCRVVEVESDVVLPADVASEKQEYGRGRFGQRFIGCGRSI